VETCPHGSLQFRFSHKKTEFAGTGMSRRKVLAAMVTGLAIVPILRAESTLSKSHKERLIRPPGARDEADFLSRCIRCGECMRVCPNNALQPAFDESGLEGLWTPVVTPKIGYCDPSCVLCTEVCPTGAIQQLTPRQKAWATKDSNVSMPVRVGTAVYDRERCLPWAKATDCTVCIEWCPVTPKAIYVEDAKVIDADGKPRTLKRPHVDKNRCVGCGACEFSCPLQEQAAVYVTNSGESRSRHN
jgi:MauM/NapG family ferredoxin protein